MPAWRTAPSSSTSSARSGSTICWSKRSTARSRCWRAAASAAPCAATWKRPCAACWRRRDRGEIPAFRRVLVETTGLADPAPIVQLLLNNPLVSHFVRLDAVVTTVDAVHGERQLDAHAEAVKQAAIADRLLLTKTDLADSGRDRAVAHAARRALNPGAHARLPCCTARSSRTRLFGAALFDPARKTADVRRWLNEDAYRAHATIIIAHASRASIDAHDRDIDSLLPHLRPRRSTGWRSTTGLARCATRAARICCASKAFSISRRGRAGRHPRRASRVPSAGAAERAGRTTTAARASSSSRAASTGRKSKRVGGWCVRRRAKRWIRRAGNDTCSGSPTSALSCASLPAATRDGGQTASISRASHQISSERRLPALRFSCGTTCHCSRRTPHDSDPALRDRIVASVERRLRRADRLHPGRWSASHRCAAPSTPAGFRFSGAARSRLRDGPFAMDRDGDRSAIPGGSHGREEHSDAPIVVGIHRPREENGPLADPAGPCRRRAAGPARHVDPPAVRSGDRGRLDLRPRRRRHEGRSRGQPFRASMRCAASACSRPRPSMSSRWSRRNRPATAR